MQTLFFKALTALKKHTNVSIYITLDQQFDVFSLILRERNIFVKNFCLVYQSMIVEAKLNKDDLIGHKIKMHNNKA